MSLSLSPSFTFFCHPPPPPTSLTHNTHPHTLSHSCVHYSCEAIDCQEPLIRNAELKCSSLGRHFYNGDRCTISCNSGYVLQVHQDDDFIKSQVSTLLHTYLNARRHLKSSVHRNTHEFVLVHVQACSIWETRISKCTHE